jgi:nicotinamidase/pyrazinamidase
MKALVLVDLQNDFMPGGALPVKEGDQIIPIITQLLKIKFDHIIASKDWHPKDHGSFAFTHRKEPGEIIDLFGLEQILWPTHCVQGTHGAEFYPGWDKSKVEKIFYKGTDKNIDSYSTFFDNGHRKSTGLDDYLRQNKVKDVYLAGLATDYCVKYSVLDALKLGFNVYVIKDACKAINLHDDDEAQAFHEMEKSGARLILSKEIAPS